MKKLRDYQQGFIPTIKPEDLTRDTLLELLKVYSRLYLAVDGFWYLSVKEKYGNEAALDRDIWVWERGIKYEMERITRVLKIQGNDVLTLMKALQLSPWFLNLAYELDVKDKNYAVLTVLNCPTLTAIEKEGSGREVALCQEVEPVLMKGYADFFNPAIKVSYIKVPPRKSKDEICCQWVFRLEDA